MSTSNASRRAIDPADIPAPGLSDLSYESNLRACGTPHTITVDRKSGRRTLGAVFPVPTKDADAWEADLKALSEEQGLSSEGHSVEARQRRDEPTADAAVTSRVLARRG